MFDCKKNLKKINLGDTEFQYLLQRINDNLNKALEVRHLIQGNDPSEMQ